MLITGDTLLKVSELTGHFNVNYRRHFVYHLVVWNWWRSLNWLVTSMLITGDTLFAIYRVSHNFSLLKLQWNTTSGQCTSLYWCPNIFNYEKLSIQDFLRKNYLKNFFRRFFMKTSNHSFLSKAIRDFIEKLLFPPPPSNTFFKKWSSQRLSNVSLESNNV